METKTYEIVVYQCPADHRRAGMWTFRCDGKESLWYSTSEAAVRRKVDRLLNPNRGSTVLLPALAGKAQTMGAEEFKREVQRLTEESTIDGFMQRGKLAGT